MAQTEFAIIEKYFRESGLCFPSQGVDLAIGDDCALLSLDGDHQLALSMDLLLEGVHFPAGAPPEMLGQRALAVNLSDLAAMGAEPMCFTLGLSLPAADNAWLEAFSAGLKKMAERFRCPLVGGDLVRGQLQMAIQVQGRIPRGEALLRSTARPGDLIYVTGTLGDAAAALALIKQSGNGKEPPAPDSPLLTTRLPARHREHLINAYYYPEPRVAVGQAIRGLASAAIDISDGLLGDLGHIAQASAVGAELDVVQLPLSESMQQLIKDEYRPALALSGGDDYELCFTVPPDNCQAVEDAVASLEVPLTRVGEIITGDKVQCLDSFGEPIPFEFTGYNHFSEDSP